MPNTPLLLADNFFENVILHPSFAVANVSGDDVAGHEAFRVADNLRDMSSWTPVAANAQRWLYVDCLANQQPTCVILDRGHNLAGKTVNVTGYTDATLTTAVATISCTIPTVAGGLPSDANGCLTPDGVWWKTFSIAAARVWALVTPALGAGVAPIVTGLYLGTAYRFPAYMNAPFADDYDTDVQPQRNELSRGGLRALSRRLNFRKIALSLDLDATDYPAFDIQVRPLLRYGQPWWVCFDDSDATHAGMMAPFQIAGSVRYTPSANPVHREIRGFELEELLPRLYT